MRREVDSISPSLYPERRVARIIREKKLRISGFRIPVWNRRREGRSAKQDFRLQIADFRIKTLSVSATERDLRF